MDAALLEAALRQALADVRLLDHPFYQRWSHGQLTTGELKTYSEQYRHFEAALPGFLAETSNRLPEGAAKQYIGQNLADESGQTGTPHVEMFGGFLDAAGGSTSAETTPATAALLDTYGAALSEGAVEAMGALVAYEMQAAEIASSKAEGLRSHYGFDAAGCEFWDVHATLDEDHSTWAIAALAEIVDDESAAVAAARRTAEAWWGFLDEREACAPAAA